MTFLPVARLGRYTAAGEVLGVKHRAQQAPALYIQRAADHPAFAFARASLSAFERADLSVSL